MRLNTEVRKYLSEGHDGNPKLTMTNQGPKIGSPLLYGWELVRVIPDQRDDKKKLRCSMIIAAETIEQVWEYLATDRMDENTEIESISRFGPIISVIRASIPPTAVSQ